MSKSQRTKGAQFEREVASMFKFAGYEAKRNLGQTRDGGHDLDVECHIPLTIECKRRKKAMQAMKWLEQADAAEQEGMSVVVTRGDGGRTAVVMYWEDWISLFQKAELWSMST